MGCAQDELYVQLADPHRRHPIGVTAETAAVELGLPPEGHPIPANHFFDVAKLARRYRQEGKSPLVIAVPQGARHSRTISEGVRVVRSIVAQAGIPARVIVATTKALRKRSRRSVITTASTYFRDPGS